MRFPPKKWSKKKGPPLPVRLRPYKVNKSPKMSEKITKMTKDPPEEGKNSPK
jgi:hypothetical protein